MRVRSRIARPWRVSLTLRREVLEQFDMMIRPRDAQQGRSDATPREADNLPEIIVLDLTLADQRQAKAITEKCQ